MLFYSCLFSQLVYYYILCFDCCQPTHQREHDDPRRCVMCDYFLAGAAGCAGAEIAGLAAGVVAFGFSV